jgi:hypothetical protein
MNQAKARSSTSHPRKNSLRESRGLPFRMGAAVSTVRVASMPASDTRGATVPGLRAPSRELSMNWAIVPAPSRSSTRITARDDLITRVGSIRGAGPWRVHLARNQRALQREKLAEQLFSSARHFFVREQVVGTRSIACQGLLSCRRAVPSGVNVSEGRVSRPAIAREVHGDLRAFGFILLRGWDSTRCSSRWRHRPQRRSSCNHRRSLLSTCRRFRNHSGTHSEPMDHSRVERSCRIGRQGTDLPPWQNQHLPGRWRQPDPSPTSRAPSKPGTFSPPSPRLELLSNRFCRSGKIVTICLTPSLQGT